MLHLPLEAFIQPRGLENQKYKSVLRVLLLYVSGNSKQEMHIGANLFNFCMLKTFTLTAATKG